MGTRIPDLPTASTVSTTNYAIVDQNGVTYKATLGMIKDLAFTSAVQTSDIADGAVTNPKLASDAVSNDKIATNTIQPDKLLQVPTNNLLARYSPGDGSLQVVSIGDGLYVGGGVIGISSLPSVTSGTYGSSSLIPVVTVNERGQVVSITEVSVSGGGGGIATVSVSASGISAVAAVSGTQLQLTLNTPAPTSVSVSNGGIGSFSATLANNHLVINTSVQAVTSIGLSATDIAGTVTNPNGDARINVSLTPTGVSAATYGAAGEVPQFTVDSKGRITAVTRVSIATGSGTVTSVGLVSEDSNIVVSGTDITTAGRFTVRLSPSVSATNIHAVSASLSSLNANNIQVAGTVSATNLHAASASIGNLNIGGTFSPANISTGTVSATDVHAVSISSSAYNGVNMTLSGRIDAGNLITTSIQVLGGVVTAPVVSIATGLHAASASVSSINGVTASFTTVSTTNLHAVSASVSNIGGARATFTAALLTTVSGVNLHYVSASLSSLNAVNASFTGTVSAVNLHATSASINSLGCSSVSFTSATGSNMRVTTLSVTTFHAATASAGFLNCPTVNTTSITAQIASITNTHSTSISVARAEVNSYLQIKASGTVSAPALWWGTSANGWFVSGGVVSQVAASAVSWVMPVSTTVAEQVRFNETGVLIGNGRIVSGAAGLGILFTYSGQGVYATSATDGTIFNRVGNDGTLITWRRDGADVGTISVVAGVVTYGAVCLHHETQFVSGASHTVLPQVGSPVATVNEFCDWGAGQPVEDRLPKITKAVPRDARNVYGLFQRTDDVDDAFIICKGSFWALVSGPATAGYLLQANGTGACYQVESDIITSRTLARVNMGDDLTARRLVPVEVLR